MPIVNTREMMLNAASGGYAVGAFSVTSLVQIEGVVDAAVEKRSPVILQTSMESAQFLGAEVLTAVFRSIASVAPVPLGLHLNHCTDAQYAAKCAELGYTSVMIDGSRLPYEQNIQQTCQVVEDCHRLGNI